MIDLLTDLYMIYKFFNTKGQEGYGRFNAWLMGLTMFFQITIAYVQNHKKLKFFFQDSVAVMTGLTPALDAYRVGSGAEQDEHQPFSPMHEMTLCKAAGTVFEAVPSSTLQIYVLLQAKERGKDAMVSVIVSVASIAFTSSMISYDWDTSPTQRNIRPLLRTALSPTKHRVELFACCR